MAAKRKARKTSKTSLNTATETPEDRPQATNGESLVARVGAAAKAVTAPLRKSSIPEVRTLRRAKQGEIVYRLIKGQIVTADLNVYRYDAITGIDAINKVRAMLADVGIDPENEADDARLRNVIADLMETHERTFGRLG